MCNTVETAPREKGSDLVTKHLAKSRSLWAIERKIVNLQTVTRFTYSQMLTWTFTLLKVVWLWHKYVSRRITAAGLGA